MNRVTWRLALRSAGLWLASRAVLAAFGVLPVGAGPGVSTASPSGIRSAWPTSVGVVVVVTVLALVDVRRRRERVFLADLGVSRRFVAVTAAAVGGGLELVVVAAGSWLTAGWG